MEKKEKLTLAQELASLKKLKKTFILAGVVLLVVLAALVAIYVSAANGVKAKYQEEIAQLNEELKHLKENPIVLEPIAPEVDLSVINTELKEIGELATMEYLYTDAASFENSKKLLNIKIPGTTKTFVAKWNGIIKAGVKVDGIYAELNEAEKILTVYIPQAEILSHEIDENSMETLDQKNGLFNPVKVEDVRNFDAVNKGAMEKRAIENGVLEKAQESAETVITKLLRANPAITEDYTIKFEEQK